MIVSITGIQHDEPSWHPRSCPILIGKGILELLSSSMHIQPLSIYREYLQNSADAIDDARRLNILGPSSAGRVDINIDSSARTVRIRDNGTGLSEGDFESRLTAFGASAKRGSQARGLRGVGRLAGLGYCQELLFRSRACGERFVRELHWDCRKIRAILRSHDSSGDLTDVVNQSVSVRKVDGKGWPDHFFEVELCNIVRHGDDGLLNPVAIYDYLCQVAPVPFCPDFRFTDSIVETLQPYIALGDVQICFAGIDTPVFRPHRNRFELKADIFDEFSDVEIIRVPGVDGGTAAIGWILHHGYKGTIPQSNLRGLRLRSGNIQVGGNDSLEELFTEVRFNSWSVGEVHVLDSRIVPNGRRDHYEQNVHYHNLVNHLAPVAREISSRCRHSSVKRNILRQFTREECQVRENFSIIRQGSLSSAERKRFERSTRHCLQSMERIAGRDLLSLGERRKLGSAIKRLNRKFEKVCRSRYCSSTLARFPSHKRRVFERVFGLIYECSANPASAKLLIDRVLAHLH